VRRVKDLGADFVKVYNSAPQIPREAFLAIIDEARRHGLRVTGHLTADILFSEASAAGMDFEHLAYILRACSKNERELPAGPPDEKGMQALLGSFDPEQVKGLMASFVRHGTWVTPTLDVSIINTLRLSDPDPADPRRSYFTRENAANLVGPCQRPTHSEASASARRVGESLPQPCARANSNDAVRWCCFAGRIRYGCIQSPRVSGI